MPHRYTILRTRLKNSETTADHSGIPFWLQLVVPLYATAGVLAVIAWTFIAFTALGGYGKATNSAKLIVFGLDGIAALVVIGTLMLALLIQVVLEAARLRILAMILGQHDERTLLIDLLQRIERWLQAGAGADTEGTA